MGDENQQRGGRDNAEKPTTDLADDVHPPRAPRDVVCWVPIPFLEFRE